MKMRMFLFVCRLLVGALFIYSGLSKLIQPIEYFEVAVAQYNIAPESIIHYVCLVVPWVELIFGAHVLLGFMLEFAAEGLAVLAGVFQLIIGQALWRRLPMDECGCFGGGFIHLTLYQSFALDTLLILILIQIASADATIFDFDTRLKTTLKFNSNR